MYSKNMFSLVKPRDKIRVYVKSDDNVYNIIFIEGKNKLDEEFITVYANSGKVEIPYENIIHYELVRDTKIIRCHECSFLNSYNTRAYRKCKCCNADLTFSRIINIFNKIKVVN